MQQASSGQAGRLYGVATEEGGRAYAGRRCGRAMTQGRAAGKPAPARAGARARRARGAGVGFAVGPGARGGRCGHSAALSAALSATSHCDCGPAQHLHYFKCRYISCGCLLVFVLVPVPRLSSAFLAAPASPFLRCARPLSSLPCIAASRRGHFAWPGIFPVLCADRVCGSSVAYPSRANFFGCVAHLACIALHPFD